MTSFILVAGVPGTGKTSVAVKLARRTGCKYLNLSWLVLEKGLWTAYDSSRKSFVVDFDGLVKTIRGIRENCVVFDTHWVEPFYTARIPVRRVIVLRTEPLILLSRLERRFWPPPKIAENVEAELLGILTTEATEFYDGLVWEIDTSNKSPEESVEEAIDSLTATTPRCCIDWLSVMEEERLEKVLSYISRHSAQNRVQSSPVEEE